MLIESGNRIHITEFDWPKGMMPSGFSMKVSRANVQGISMALSLIYVSYAVITWKKYTDYIFSFDL